jgi:tetratricopeptide (TPR) repeat protein
MTELLRAGAERYGWIVASPYTSSNLIPMEENFKIMSALWADTHTRLAIDDRRVYALGFSGLSRFVCMLGLTAPESLAGVIGANGGFPLGHPPTRETPFPFFSTVGDKDFNYYELLDLDDRLAALRLPHRLEIFPGSHEWPPEGLLTLAIGWLELKAMQRGTREKSPALVDALWSADLARARAFEAAAQPVEAVRAYASLLDDYAGLRAAKDLDEAARRRAALEASETYQREHKVRQDRDRQDREYLERVPGILHGAKSELRPDAVSELLTELKVPELKRQAKSADVQERLAAERLLYAVYIQTGLYLPRELSERKQYDRALFFLQIAAEIDPDVPHIPFRMATAWAQKGNRRKALDELALAVQKGWSDVVALESERAFDPLRQNEEYRKIVAEMLRRRKPPAR